MICLFQSLVSYKLPSRGGGSNLQLLFISPNSLLLGSEVRKCKLEGSRTVSEWSSIIVQSLSRVCRSVIISLKHHVWSSSTRQLERLLDPQHRMDSQRLSHNQSWPHEGGLHSPLIPPRCGFLTLSASRDENYLFGVIVFIKFYPSPGGHSSEDGGGGEIRNKYRIHCSITNGVHSQEHPAADPNTNPCSPFSPSTFLQHGTATGHVTKISEHRWDDTVESTFLQHVVVNRIHKRFIKWFQIFSFFIHQVTFNECIFKIKFK